MEGLPLPNHPVKYCGCRYTVLIDLKMKKAIVFWKGIKDNTFRIGVEFEKAGVFVIKFLKVTEQFYNEVEKEQEILIPKEV